jgi:hypothetical protein
VLVVAHRDTYAPERAYVHELVLAELLGLQWTSSPRLDGPVQITCPELGEQALRLPDRLFSLAAADWLTERSLPATPLRRLDVSRTGLRPTLEDPSLPLIYGSEPRPRAREPELELEVDVFGSVFFLVTRYEEYVLGGRDEHERFPAADLLASREGFLHRPLVNEYAELLRSAIGVLWPRLRTRRRTFREHLSHDVDWPGHPSLTLAQASRRAAADVVRRRDPALGLTAFGAWRARRAGQPAQDPYDTFDFIMERSEAAGLRSAFYFMPGCTDPRYDSPYTLAEPWIGRLIRRIADRGHELGLHPSYGTFRRPELIAAEFEELRSTCARLGIEQETWGGRQHFLRWENPTTWRAWASAGLAYDGSLGFSSVAGFRSGICCEHPVYDLEQRCALTLRERPLVVMEMAVMRFDRRDGGDGVATIERLRQTCRRYEGDFSLLWHNSQLASPRQRRLYVRALAAGVS